MTEDWGRGLLDWDSSGRLSPHTLAGESPVPQWFILQAVGGRGRKSKVKVKIEGKIKGKNKSKIKGKGKVKVKIKINIKIKVKGIGQECPIHTSIFSAPVSLRAGNVLVGVASWEDEETIGGPAVS